MDICTYKSSREKYWPSFLRNPGIRVLHIIITHTFLKEESYILTLSVIMRVSLCVCPVRPSGRFPFLPSFSLSVHLSKL